VNNPPAPPTDKRQAERFRALFSGLERAYGQYSMSPTAAPDAEGKIKGTVIRTLFAPVTLSLYEAHLAGTNGLGIVPIRDDSTCVFGAIDIDVYADLDHTAIAQGLKKLDLPLIPCRSKSGGAHLYVFTKAPVPAAKLASYLKQVSAVIGHGHAEIFPKQNYLDPDSPGSWLNLPYYAGDAGTRYAIRPDGSAMTLVEFLDHAESMKVGVQALSNSIKSDTAFPDGPPCLQALEALGGCPAGSRNNGLFSIGVYLRKSHPDNYGGLLEEYNQKFMQPPLPSEEIVNIKKSVGRKTYNYRCSEEPLVSHCNAGACRLRRYGIGGSSTPMPQFGQLKKLETDPPSYTWELNGKVIPLSPDELLSYLSFSRAVFMRLNTLLPPLKPAQWKETLAAALETMEIIPMPADASPDGQLWEHVKSFCQSNNRALALEEVLSGNPFLSEDGMYYLRIQDLVRYLGIRHFKAPAVQEIAASLRRHGGKHWEKKLSGQTVNLWILPESCIGRKTEEPYAVPESVTDQKQF
jgi:hypothetical protein